jgi:predicted nucleic acid-binding protein
MNVVADTGPLNYLIQIGETGILRILFAGILIPRAVQDELSRAPAEVRSWIATPPAWLQVREPARIADTRLMRLGPGERETILLAAELGEARLILDDMAGRREAERRGLRVTGTLGVLQAAGQKGLLDFGDALNRLRRTNFHLSQKLADRFIAESGQ